MKHEKPRRCPSCRQATLQSATRMREFHPHGKDVHVELLTLRCSACGTEATSAAQHAENLSRLKARKAEYDGLLMGEEILALRRRYGITQQAAAKIFGKGKIAFSRYENEVTFPDESTTDLLQLAIEKPDVIKRLADKKGVELPLWAARCEDERGVKVRVMSDIRMTDPTVQRWAQQDLTIGAGMRRGFPFSLLLETSSAEFMTTSGNDEQFQPVEAAFA